MTNHPRRSRDDDAPENATPEEPAEVPAAFSPNGHGPTTRQLLEQLPQMLMQAFANVLMQVPVRTVGGQRACAVCLTQRVTWEHAHDAEIAAAKEAAVQAAGTPELAGLDFTAFLPPDLRPGGGDKAVPEVRQGVTIAQGAEVCAQHLPGVPEAGKRPFLIANQSLSSAMLAEMMRGQPA